MKDLNILAFLSEKYYHDECCYYAKPTSAKFLQDTFSKDRVVVVSPVTENKMSGYSSVVHQDLFEAIPYFDSIKDFVFSSMFRSGFLKNYIRRCNQLLDKYPGHLIWVRNPSISSIVFSVCALLKNRVVINHMCANSLKGWKNEKYNLFEKIVGYFFSKILYSLVRYVVRCKNTINLCTGDELYRLCVKMNKESYQFVDMMIDEKKNLLPQATNLSERMEFLYVGRVEFDKGVDELCTAFCMLNKNNTYLTVVGDGAALYELKVKYGSAANINFIGQVSHDDLSGFFIKSSVVVIPSKNSYEGFPRVIMESWVYGKPVIVSNTGGVKEFVKHDDNGLLVKRGCVKSLLKAMHDISNQDVYNKLLIGVERSACFSTYQYWSDSILGIIKGKYAK